jgi:membrane glycosyltransferase
MLLAPVMMLFQSHFVFGTLLGYRVSWSSQQRDDADLPWSEAARRHWAHMLLGVVFAGVSFAVSAHLLPWIAPVVVGLLLAIPLTVLTARASLGMRAARAGLFLIPEESEPSQLLERAAELSARELEVVEDGVEWVLTDARAHALHLALLESQPAPVETPALASARRKLLAGPYEPLSTQEKAAVLLDAGTLAEARGRRMARAS